MPVSCFREVGCRAVIVSVDYWDILRITLPYNIHHFSDVLVITSYEDDKTSEIAERYGARVHRTSAFYAGGAHFNKYKAIEEGFDILGRSGWLAILDADIVLPRFASVPSWHVDCLYTAPRRVIFSIPESIPEESAWDAIPDFKERLWIGYLQVFHASSPYLSDPPWHMTDIGFAGIGDREFGNLWPHCARRLFPFHVLHIGEPAKNWFGRVSPYADGSTPENVGNRVALMKRALSDIRLARIRRRRML